MWSTLSRLAFAAEEYAIAQRCAVALGDIAKANYLAKVCLRFFLFRSFCAPSLGACQSALYG